MKKKNLHRITGTLAMLLVTTFLISTTVSELFLEVDTVIIVKRLIAMYGLPCIIFLMAFTAYSARKISKASQNHRVSMKIKRTKLLIFNGLFLMVPLAILLAFKAQKKELDTLFYILQVIEIFSGMIQLWLMAHNAHDGHLIKNGK